MSSANMGDEAELFFLLVPPESHSRRVRIGYKKKLPIVIIVTTCAMMFERSKKKNETYSTV